MHFDFYSVPHPGPRYQWLTFNPLQINGEAAAEPVVAPKKTPGKKKITLKKVAQKDGDDGEPTTPEPPKKRTPTKKKEKKAKPEVYFQSLSATFLSHRALHFQIKVLIFNITFLNTY